MKKKSNQFKVLYIDGEDVRKMSDFYEADTSDVRSVAIVAYTDFMGDGSFIQNGVYPVIASEDFSSLEGRLLTICDASFADKEQRKAFKDLVKSTTREWYNKHLDTASYWANQLNSPKADYK